MEHGSKDNAVATAAKQFNETTTQDAWMVACFYVKDGKVHLKDTTWEFPVASLQDALNLLQRSLSQRLQVTETREPLPVADHVTAEPEGVADAVAE